MGVISIIFLVLRIMWKLPDMMRVGKEIIELIKKFKDGGFLHDLNIIYEILKLILGLAKTNKTASKEYFKDLHTTMKVTEVKTSVAAPLEGLRDRIRSQHETFFSASDLVK